MLTLVVVTMDKLTGTLGGAEPTTDPYEYSVCLYSCYWQSVLTLPVPAQP